MRRISSVQFVPCGTSSLSAQLFVCTPNLHSPGEATWRRSEAPPLPFGRFVGLPGRLASRSLVCDAVASSSGMQREQCASVFLRLALSATPRSWSLLERGACWLLLAALRLWLSVSTCLNYKLWLCCVVLWRCSWLLLAMTDTREVDNVSATPRSLSLLERGACWLLLTEAVASVSTCCIISCGCVI